jgi:predicted nucleic acid-binding protein
VIQLDTSFLIKALVGGSMEDDLLRQWLRRRESLAMSSIAWTEFACGPVSPGAVEAARRLVGEPLPFTAVESDRAALLFNETGRRRGSLVDCMIAATSIEAGDRLATSNSADFARFARLGLELAT